MSDLGNKEIFAKNLKYYMKYYGKDKTSICNELKIPYTTFVDWYNAVTYPRIDKIELLANYFNIQKSDLIENKYKDNNDLSQIKVTANKTNPLVSAESDELELMLKKAKPYLSSEDYKAIKLIINKAIKRYEENNKNSERHEK